MDTSADVLQLIEESYKTFSKGQRYIADYICNNYDKAVDMTAARLGKIVGVSESTVVRFATELGFKGYPQFQKALGELVKQRLSSVQRISLAYERLSESPDLISSVLHNDIQNLKHTEEMIDRDAFYRAVDLIGDARKIYVIGGRSCSTLASFLNYYLSYIFDDVRLIRSDSVTESIEEIHRIGEQDVILAISFPRYSVKTRTVRRRLSLLQTANSHHWLNMQIVRFMQAVIWFPLWIRLLHRSVLLMHCWQR